MKTEKIELHKWLVVLLTRSGNTLKREYEAGPDDIEEVYGEIRKVKNPDERIVKIEDLTANEPNITAKTITVDKNGLTDYGTYTFDKGNVVLCNA